MSQLPKANADDFWDREALLAQRENTLFAIEEELRRREEILLEREAALGALDQEYAARESVLLERELTLRETEALLYAQARMADSVQGNTDGDIKALETKALGHLQAQFDEREASLKAAEAVLHEREAFIERSENTISEKGQQLQEWEAELEHLHDELKGGAH